MTLPQAFRPFLGKRETSGKNRSAVIDNLNAWVGAPMGSPYCATTQCRCLHDCAVANGDSAEKPKTASSLQFRRWFEKRHLVSRDPQDLLKWKGAFAGWTNEDGHGHVMLVIKRHVHWFTRKVIAFSTYEANTGPDGGRDGDGFYERKRKIGEREFWFCNATALPGGSYW